MASAIFRFWKERVANAKKGEPARPGWGGRMERNAGAYELGGMGRRERKGESDSEEKKRNWKRNEPGKAQSIKLDVDVERK